MSDEFFTVTVIWFKPKPGFGFITWQEEKDIFVHFSDIVSEGFKMLKKGQKVKFKIGKNLRGEDKAVEVSIVKV